MEVVLTNYDKKTIHGSDANASSGLIKPKVKTILRKKKFAAKVIPSESLSIGEKNQDNKVNNYN